MSHKRISLVITIALLGLLLTACTGGTTTNSWSGVLVTETNIYYAGGGQVYSLRDDNGNTVWSYPEKTSATRLFFAEPVLAGEQLIVGDYASTLTSLDVMNGTEKWQFQEARGRYIDSPLVINDLIIAPNADYNIYALDFSGNLKWKFTGEHAFWAKPASDGTVAFASCMDHFIYAIDLATGELKWKTDLGASSVARPLLDGTGKLYIGNLDGSMFALSVDDGSIDWQQKLGGGIWSQPVLYEGKLYFGDQSGDVNVVDAENGSINQSIQTDGAILGAGALLENGIAFGNENGELILFGFGGEKIWTRSFDGELLANLQVFGDRLVVIPTKGEKPLIAMDANGNENWYFSVKK